MKKKQSSTDIGKQLAEKTYQELGWNPKMKKFLEDESLKREARRDLGENRRYSPSTSYPSPNPSYRSPVSSYKLTVPKTPFRIRAIETTSYQSPSGTTYRFSALYRNAVILQFLIEKFTAGISPREHRRLIVHLNDSARSVVSNIAEGYTRPTTREYLEFLGFSKASLEEIYTDITHAKDLGLLPSKPGSSLEKIKIILKPHSPNPFYDPLRDYKRKIGEIKRIDLTYEIFIELINKTSYLFKRTVEGLWNRLSKREQEALSSELKNLW